MLKIQVLHIKKKDLIQWFLITKNIAPIKLRYSEIELEQKNIKRVCYWKDLRQFLGMLTTVDHPKIEKYQDELTNFRYPVDVIHPPSKIKLPSYQNNRKPFEYLNPWKGGLFCLDGRGNFIDSNKLDKQIEERNKKVKK